MRITRIILATPTIGLTMALVLSGCMYGDPTEKIAVILGEKPNQDVLALPGMGASAGTSSVEEAVKRLPEIIERTLDLTGVPGMSAAVVHGDKTVFSEGYGVREVGTEKMVDAGTVFQVASLSKPLSATGVAAAIVESDGELSWSSPIHTYLPEFSFSDPAVTHLATIGDAFSHRTGLATGAGDDLEDIGFEREVILDRLTLQPLDSFRTSYHYSNFGLTVGAEAVAASRGQTWEQLMDELVFGPIGMTSSSARYDDFVAHENRALLHAKIGGEYVAAYDRDPDPQAPAGGVSSTSGDLARWMTVLLNDGVLGAEMAGTEADVLVADPEAMLAAMSPKIVSAPPMGLTERPGFYGHGFNTSALLGGRTTMSHSGAFVLGAGTAFQIVPDLDLGIVVLSNGAPVGAPEAVIAEFLDIVQFGEPTRDWPQIMPIAFEGLTAPIGDLVDQQRPGTAQEPEELGALTGRYENEYFGDMVIEKQGEGLVAKLGADQEVELALDPWNGDVFSYAPNSENAPTGSLASATFMRGGNTTVLLQSFNGSGLGTWTKVAG